MGELGGSDWMVMEKLKSWTALSNFPTTTAAAGIFVLKTELVRAQAQSNPSGAKAPNHFAQLIARVNTCPDTSCCPETVFPQTAQLRHD
jgi:hypothetical protein